MNRAEHTIIKTALAAFEKQAKQAAIKPPRGLKSTVRVGVKRPRSVRAMASKMKVVRTPRKVLPAPRRPRVQAARVKPIKSTVTRVRMPKPRVRPWWLRGLRRSALRKV